MWEGELICQTQQAASSSAGIWRKQEISANYWVNCSLLCRKQSRCSTMCKACSWQAAGGTSFKRTLCTSHASSLLVLSPLSAAFTSGYCPKLSC